MELKKHRRWRLMVAILSLSLLTVMAGAAVAPALGIIREYFSDEPLIVVQFIISMPALFIAITNLFFGKMCRLLSARKLTIFGLTMYIIFGCAAGFFSNIYLVLVCRTLLGIGVGILMPLSTGLISYYFTRDKQDMLMGYSSAMNMMGGVVATLIAGMLAIISWRLSFLVYLMGALCLIFVLLWMPDEKIADSNSKEKEKGTFAKYFPYIIGMFLLMTVFYNYPANFALEISKSGAIPQRLVPIVMAAMDIFGFIGGLIYPRLKSAFKRHSKNIAPVLFILGYVLLQFAGGFIGTLLGSFVIGAASGIGIPYLISTASSKAGKNAVATVIPALSIAMYLSQFTTPAIISGFRKFFLYAYPAGTSFHAALIMSIIFLLWTLALIDKKK
ncbi:MAG: MFS transporter [Bacillota bacterium]|nr:MFS transporter [Bacillota bacterium]